MDLDDYIEQVDSGLSPVKKLILAMLWEAGSTFPKNWVTSSHITKLTGQKYCDRRIRELRDEHGCNIETGRDGAGQHAYRMVSTDVAISNPRSYLTATQKRKLFVDTGFCCAICPYRGAFYRLP